jgi:biotin carboxylase
MKNLAIIGASYLQLPLVMKAKQRGIITHCFAWPDGAVCEEFCDQFYPISVLEKEKILEVCKQIGIDGITTIATDIAVPTISYVAAKLGLIGNSEESALKSTHKFVMRESLKSTGCNVPFYKLYRENEVVDEFSEFPLIVKPVDRSGSKGVRKVYTNSELVEAIREAREVSISKEVIIESFLEGNEVSVETISWNGKHYPLAITDKVTTGEPNFVEIAHHQPSHFSAAVQASIYEQTFKALDALDVEFGAGHTEIKVDENGTPFIIEVGARMGGDFIGSHLVELSTGYDFVGGVIDIALNQFTVPVIEQNNFSGVYFLCEQTATLEKYFRNENKFDSFKEIQNEQLLHITNSNERSGYLIYQDSDRRIDLI